MIILWWSDIRSHCDILGTLWGNFFKFGAIVQGQGHCDLRSIHPVLVNIVFQEGKLWPYFTFDQMPDWRHSSPWKLCWLKRSFVAETNRCMSMINQKYHFERTAVSTILDISLKVFTTLAVLYVSRQTWMQTATWLHGGICAPSKKEHKTYISRQRIVSLI